MPALLWTAKYLWLPSCLGVLNATAHAAAGDAEGSVRALRLQCCAWGGRRSSSALGSAPFLLSTVFHPAFPHPNADKRLTKRQYQDAQC